MGLLLALAPTGAGAGASGPRTAFPCAPGEAVKLAPPTSGAYHSAYFSPTPDETTVTAQTIDDFQTMTGRQLAAVYFSNHWGTRGRVHMHFPIGKVQAIWDNGSFPMVRFVAWSTMSWSSEPDPVVTMQRIINGRWDGQLRSWFRAARDSGIPMLVEVGTEVNGSWFPWNGKWNGGGTTDGYGNPSYPDGPERFRDAYRHIIDISRNVGADDITWNFHVDASTWPHVWWNQPKWYYPGDGYIDWISVSDYGEQHPSGNPNHWFPFSEKLGDPSDPKSSYARIARISPSKPLALIEFGVVEDPDAGDKAQWIADAYDTVTSGYYDFQLVSYWSEKWRNGDGSVSDLRVNSSAGALSAYTATIADPFFTSVPEFSCV